MGTSNSLTITSLSQDKYYNFLVVASDGTYESIGSTQPTIILRSAPTINSILTYRSTASNGSIALSWTAPSWGTPNGYRIYFLQTNTPPLGSAWNQSTIAYNSSSSNPGTSLTEINSNLISGTTYIINGLTLDHAYQFLIVALDSSNNESVGALQAKEVRSGPTLSPVYLNYSQATTSVTLSWSAPQNWNPTSYNIYILKEDNTPSAADWNPSTIVTSTGTISETETNLIKINMPSASLPSSGLLFTTISGFSSDAAIYQFLLVANDGSDDSMGSSQSQLILGSPLNSIEENIITDNYVTLNWVPPIWGDDSTTYIIYMLQSTTLPTSNEWNNITTPLNLAQTPSTLTFSSASKVYVGANKTVTINNVNIKNTCYFRIVARYNYNGTTIESAGLLKSNIAKPRFLYVDNIRNNQVRLNWTRPEYIRNGIQYVVYAALSTAPSIIPRNIANMIPVNESTFAFDQETPQSQYTQEIDVDPGIDIYNVYVNNLEPNQTYYFSVLATDGFSDSAYIDCNVTTLPAKNYVPYNVRVTTVRGDPNYKISVDFTGIACRQHQVFDYNCGSKPIDHSDSISYTNIGNATNVNSGYYINTNYQEYYNFNNIIDNCNGNYFLFLAYNSDKDTPHEIQNNPCTFDANARSWIIYRPCKGPENLSDPNTATTVTLSWDIPSNWADEITQYKVYMLQYPSSITPQESDWNPYNIKEVSYSNGTINFNSSHSDTPLLKCASVRNSRSVLIKNLNRTAYNYSFAVVAITYSNPSNGIAEESFSSNINLSCLSGPQLSSEYLNSALPGNFNFDYLNTNIPEPNISASSWFGTDTMQLDQITLDQKLPLVLTIDASNPYSDSSPTVFNMDSAEIKINRCLTIGASPSDLQNLQLIDLSSAGIKVVYKKRVQMDDGSIQYQYVVLQQDSRSSGNVDSLAPGTFSIKPFFSLITLQKIDLDNITPNEIDSEVGQNDNYRILIKPENNNDQIKDIYIVVNNLLGTTDSMTSTNTGMSQDRVLRLDANNSNRLDFDSNVYLDTKIYINKGNSNNKYTLESGSTDTLISVPISQGDYDYSNSQSLDPTRTNLDVTLNINKDLVNN